MKQAPLWLIGAALAIVALGGAIAWQGGSTAADSAPLCAADSHEVHADHAFGFQAVPKFDEKAGKGAWQGSRARGLAMHRDLGVQVSREGFIWRHYEPEGQGDRPHMADFDDVVDRLEAAGIAVEAMVTETPLWASTAPRPNPKDPATYKSAPPKGLDAPIFTDGTDAPAPGKRLNPDNTWATALGGMVERYRGRVRYWQMWNEPDYPKGDQRANFSDPQRSWFGSVDDYVRLLKVGHTVVKWLDPQAQVVTGGIGFGDYLTAMLDRGAGAYFDQIDFHAYGWPGSDTALAQFVKVHDQMRAVLARHHLDEKGLICSETGYTALQPEIQADYIAKLYPTAIAMCVESTMYYANVNPSWKHMGLVDWRTMTQRTQGYWAYKNAATALRGVERVTGLRLEQASGYRFDRQDGSAVYVLWAPDRAKDAPRRLTLTLPAGHWQLRDSLGRSLGTRPGGPTPLDLTASPLWIDADAKRAYAPIRPNPPLAYPGLAIASALADSLNENYGPATAAIDLDTNTHWVNGAYKQPSAWLRLALSQESPVGELRLKTGPTPAGTWFDVEASTDGERYQPVAQGQRLTTWAMETIKWDRPVRARYLRLLWHNPERRPVSFSVFEVEAHP